MLSNEVNIVNGMVRTKDTYQKIATMGQYDNGIYWGGN